jgi:hypothetical protein
MKPLLLLLLLTGTGTLPARSNEVTNFPFRVGEKLTYQIYWGPFVAGKATLEIDRIDTVANNDCYHILVRVNTSGFADFLYHIEDQIESWLDVDELCTRRYRQDRKEGKHHRFDDSFYDYSNKQILTTNLINGKLHSYPLDGPAQDLISSLYFARTKPLQLDVAEKFRIALGKGRYEVTIKPDARKSLYFRPTGNVQALRLEPTPTISVVSANKGRMWFWVSDDPRKLLLLITTDMTIGSAKFVLSQVEPPTSKSRLPL